MNFQLELEIMFIVRLLTGKSDIYLVQLSLEFHIEYYGLILITGLFFIIMKFQFGLNNAIFSGQNGGWAMQNRSSELRVRDRNKL
jgi:hypothetical protein